MDSTHSLAPLCLVPEELRCKYPSKRCESVRVLKRDGDLHRFCEFHRVKANLNQQRLEQRRKMAHLSTRRLPASPKRAKRSRSLSCQSSPTSVTDVDEELFKLPALDVVDLDLDLLGDLLDVPAPEALNDDTHAALHLLDFEPASLDSLQLTERL